MSENLVRALTRGIPASFARATVAPETVARADPAIDVPLARRQHAAYVAALQAVGLAVLAVPPDDAHPDCCFIEDCALVADGVALLTRPGEASRRGEVDGVATALAELVAIHRMAAPATLDGGDCLRLGRRIYVGRSARTNAAGVECVRAVFGPHGFEVIAVPLAASGVLHLKCVCAPLGEDRVLVADGALPAGTFGAAAVVRVPAEESYAANCVAYGGRVLLSDGYPRARRAVEAAGFEVLPLATSELRKADGSLTCLSILVGL